MKSFISLEKAVEILNSNTKALQIEEVSLINAVNKILAEDVYSKINNPPFDKSAMDGYAIICDDTLNSKSRFKVIDKVYAGEVSKHEVTNNTAIKIMTGAPIPKGANCVIKQEDVVIQGNFIEIDTPMKFNQNICLEGEDIKKGSILVNKYKKLNYADIGIIASSGINKVKVYKKPKVAFISTGDEVIDINENLIEGKIYNSNKYSILSRLYELGYEVIGVDHAKDISEDIGNIIKEFSKKADLIITTGGVSVGEKDLLKDVIDEIGGNKLLWKVNIKPGSAVLCSKVNEVVVISLSGNPTASLTTFELLAKTTLEKLSGKENIEIKREKAYLIGSLKKKSNQRRFIRGKIVYNNGKQCVEITQIKSGNGILSSAINSNCLIEVEKGNEGIEEGTLVDVIKF